MRVKVCCVQDQAELDTCVELGASVVGFVSEMRAPGAIPDDQIGSLVAATPPPIVPMLLTRATTADALLRHLRSVPTPAVQLVRHVDDEEIRRVRDSLPEVCIVRVVYVVDDESIRTASDYSSLADVLLLDSAHNHPARPQLGGSGIVHDWQLSRQIRNEVDAPIMLAGGLTPENVAEAITTVQPFAVDVCTGVRDAEHRLQPRLLAEFIAAAQETSTLSHPGPDWPDLPQT